MLKKLLIIDDEVAICRTLQIHFRGNDFEVSIAHDAESAEVLADKIKPHVIVLDIRMPGKSGLDILPSLKATLPDSHIIMITAFHDMESTIEAMQQGADEYIQKPIDLNELDAAVNKAMKACDLQRKDVINIQNIELKDGSKKMVGGSQAMLDVFKIRGRVARTPATVLITGESGTGKEMAARAIHASSLNSDGAFVAINCAAMIESLIESEMFGHIKGAFTGATSNQPGKFEIANDGTIFLDEIGELSQSLQAKLLRVLQEKEYCPIGSKETKLSTARVLSATNRNLLKEVKEGRFREDLYYRLQVINLNMPPLRERVEELPQLVNVLLAQINHELNRKVKQITKEVMHAFHAYSWPGNIRELENLLTKAVAISPDSVLTIDLFPQLNNDNTFEKQAPPVTTSNLPNTTLVDGRTNNLNEEQSLQDIEKLHVIKILTQTNWHRGKACDLLGVSRPRLQRLIIQYSLQES
jgi:DNA-binding NtrC family response regulator